MQKYSLSYTILCIIVVSLFFTQCKKHTDPLLTRPLLSNITLHDKPLPVIQRYVSGKWKLEYTYGGIIANLRSDYHDKDYFWQIDKGSHIKQWDMGNLFTDASIEWYPESRYTYVGPTFIMKFYDKRMYPNNYVVIGIVQDSLVLKDFSSDPATYHFSKQN